MRPWAGAFFLPPPLHRGIGTIAVKWLKVHIPYSHIVMVKKQNFWFVEPQKSKSQKYFYLF